MKNRLEIAKELLRDDGVIFVQCDDNEQAYLKVLMDEIFGRENFVGNLIWKNKLGGGNDTNIFVVEHEYIMVYAKNKPRITDFCLENVDNGKYSHADEFIETRGKYALEALYRSSISFSENLFYPIKAPDGSLIYPNESDKNSTNHIWRWSKETFFRKKQEGRIEFKYTKNGWRVFSKQYFLQNDDGTKRMLKARSIIDFIGNRQGTEHLKLLFNGKIFNNPKPEALIKRIIEISTKEGDIVLDFFAGSGTTPAVAHKMQRKWIAIEQMDYIENITKERLKKVIGSIEKVEDSLINEEKIIFDEGGISKAVNYQGGGDFIYFELKKFNQNFMDDINNATTELDILQIRENIIKNSFLEYNVDMKELENSLEEFKSQSLAEQKKILIDILDKNQLYVNFSEREDAMFNCMQDEISFSEYFYNNKLSKS